MEHVATTPQLMGRPVACEGATVLIGAGSMEQPFEARYERAKRNPGHDRGADSKRNFVHSPNIMVE